MSPVAPEWAAVALPVSTTNLGFWTLSGFQTFSYFTSLVLEQLDTFNTVIDML
jgi:hypothetical protein